MDFRLLVLLILLLAGCTGEMVSPPAALFPVPSAAQLQWYEMEQNVFVHFTTNTFTDLEWGFGDENPATFIRPRWTLNNGSQLLRTPDSKALSSPADTTMDFVYGPVNPLRMISQPAPEKTVRVILYKMWPTHAGAWVEVRRLPVSMGSKSCAIWQTTRYHLLTSATTIGYKRILKFDPVKTDKLRISITGSHACPLISNVEAY